MERLTKYLASGAATYDYPVDCCSGVDCNDRVAKSAYRQTCVERLAAYEDTGLTPEEIKKIGMETEAGCVKAIAWTYGVDINRIRELAEADKDGCVIIVPCKVGDTVYFALLGKIIEKQVFSIVAFSNSTRIYCGGTSEYFRPEDIGKTFFLTSEEAEKALEAMKNE